MNGAEHRSVPASRSPRRSARTCSIRSPPRRSRGDRPSTYRELVRQLSQERHDTRGDRQIVGRAYGTTTGRAYGTTTCRAHRTTAGRAPFPQVSHGARGLLFGLLACAVVGAVWLGGGAVSKALVPFQNARDSVVSAVQKDTQPVRGPDARTYSHPDGHDGTHAGAEAAGAHSYGTSGADWNRSPPMRRPRRRRPTRLCRRLHPPRSRRHYRTNLHGPSTPFGWNTWGSVCQ